MEDPVRNPGYVDSKGLHRISGVTTRHKQRMFELLKIEPGMRLLDVGCGPGTDTIRAAQFLGEDGLAIGVDYDESMIKEANERAQEFDVAVHARHTLGNALSLPFRSNSFHICTSERLFQHIGDSRQVLEEMVRVTKAEGNIVVADADWCSLSIDTINMESERRIVRALQRLVRNGYAGRQLFRLFKEQSLADVQVEVHPIIWTDFYTFRATSLSIGNLNRKLVESGEVTEEELKDFFMGLEEAHNRGVFFASASIMLAAGVKRA